MNEPQHTIAFVIDGLSFGGAEKQVAILARSLPKAYRPIVISLSNRLDPYGDDLMARGIDVIALPRRSHNDLKRLWGLKRILKDSNARIVHGWLDAANAYAYTAGRMLGRPVILSLRNELLCMSGGKASVLAWMLRHCDGVLVNSRAGEVFMDTKIRVERDKIIHIGNWVDPDKIVTARTISNPSERPTIGFVGRFAKQKRLHLLVAAFAGVLKRIPRARLILMGDGDERDALADQSTELGIEEHVEFVAQGTNVEETMRRFHVLALTSAFEGMPNVAIEALALGIPVISTRVGGVDQLILEGKTGLFFSNDTPETISETLVRALSDHGLLETAMTSGPKLVESKCSIESALTHLLPVYDRLATGK